MADKQPSRRNAPALALHVPEPPFRPGDTPDFSSIKVPAAGSAPRPDTAVAASETHSLATDLVRVLDEQGRAVGPWDPKLDADTLRKILKDMVTVRVFDDRMYRAQRQGKTSFYMKCTGEEAIACSAAAAMDFDDIHFPTYRQQGLLVARGYPLKTMMCQI
jgi:2-oxoisovalerate dehydrogenase E1 component alpha subunit